MVFVKASYSRRFISLSCILSTGSVLLGGGGRGTTLNELFSFFFLFGKQGKPIGRLDFFSEH